MESIDMEGLDGRLSGAHNRCYCAECYRADWPDTITNKGPTKYVVPRGWYRFSLPVEAPAGLVQTMFEEWSVSFHGMSQGDRGRGPRGVHLNPPGPLLTRPLEARIASYACSLSLLDPLAERACLSLP